MKSALDRLLFEPPLRLLAKAFYSRFARSVHTRGLWDASPRPNYLNGLILAAEQARSQDVASISAIEFGVAGGNGLVAMQNEAAAVAAETGVSIKVYGFDNGPAGLPDFIGDHRDHPDAWGPGDYPMDPDKLRSRLSPATTLILGNISRTVPDFVAKAAHPPLGFVSIDVDLYSSTMQALKIFTLPGANTLNRTFLYFDDVDLPISHKFAGELLAIDEFNASNADIKIDILRGFRAGRPFPEKSYLDMMYVAHNLKAISSSRVCHTPLMTHTLVA